MTSIDAVHRTWSQRQAANTRHLAAWTAAWLATMAIATFGSLLVWPDHTALKGAAIAVNVGVGVGMILANRRHLLGLDELQQRIQLHAMAWSLGAGLILGTAYSSLDVTGVIGFDAEISHLVMAMGLIYLGATIAGTRRVG